MLMKNRVNKENCSLVSIRKAASVEESSVFKGREFGTELTNNTDAISECETDERSPGLSKEVSYESNIPKTSPKTQRLNDHNKKTSISQRCVSPLIFSLNNNKFRRNPCQKSTEQAKTSQNWKETN